MENKKKTIFNVIFLLVVFTGTMYGVFHGEDIGEIVKILEQVNVLWLIPGVICVVVFIWGESIIIYYMMRTLKIRLKKWTWFSVFIGWILLQLYHTFGIWRTAGTDLLYEKRKDTNTGFDAGADDRYDHL